MKIRKRAEQKNFRVNKYYYNDVDYMCLLKIDGVGTIGGSIVVFSEGATDVKVVLDEYGYYTTVAVMKTGEQIYIEL